MAVSRDENWYMPNNSKGDLPLTYDLICVFSKQDCDFNECIQGCQYVKVGLQKGCYQACSNNTNETFQSDGSKLNCIDVCKQTSQKFMTSVIKSVQNVSPPNIVANQIRDFSLVLTFSKEYLKKIKDSYPEINIGE